MICMLRPKEITTLAHSPIQYNTSLYIAPPTATVDCEIECGPDLKTCVSVQYEVNNSVHGVKLSNTLEYWRMDTDC